MRRTSPIIDPWKDFGIWVVIDTACNASVHSTRWRKHFDDILSGRRCFLNLAKPHTFFVKRLERSFAGLGGADAAKCIGRRKWLLSQCDVREIPLPSSPVMTNEILGGDILCLFGLDLQVKLGIHYNSVTNQCFREISHGRFAGQTAELPVCFCAGSHLPMIRIDQYEMIDDLEARGPWG